MFSLKGLRDRVHYRTPNMETTVEEFAFITRPLILDEEVIFDDDDLIKKAMDVCYNMTYPPRKKIEILLTLKSKFNHEEILSKLRDTLRYTTGSTYDNLVSFLSKVVENENFDDHQRQITAVHLFNLGCLGVCYESFLSVLRSPSVELHYRLDAAKYLFATQLSKWSGHSSNFLCALLKDVDRETRVRYFYIVPYISRKGLRTASNNSKLLIPYCEEFVAGLQQTFFFEGCKITDEYKDLSGQHLLQMSEVSVPVETKEKVIEELLHSCKSRIESADIILRLGDAKNKAKARVLIKEHSLSVSRKEGCKGPQTIYEDSQNVHSADVECFVEKFIEKMMTEETAIVQSTVTSQTVQEPKLTFEAVVSKLFEIKGTRESVDNFTKGLEMISIDTATFTTSNATLQDILVGIFTRIRSPLVSIKTQKILEQNIIDAIEGMAVARLCSSGYAANLVGVLALIDDDFRISFFEQIKASTKGRLLARIRDCKDEDITDSLSMATMIDSSPEDREVYYTFVSCNLSFIEQELREELVSEGYLPEEEFIEYFETVRDEWLRGYEDAVL